VKKICVLLAASIIGVSPVAMAQVACGQVLLESPAGISSFKATAQERAELLAKYPQFAEQIEKAVLGILNKKIPVETVADVTDIPNKTQIRKSFSEQIDFNNIDPIVAQTIVGVFNRLRNQQELATYVRELMQDAGVYMMKNPDHQTNQIANFPNVKGELIKGQKITKQVFLDAGIIDHHSLLIVLVHRIRERGDKIAVIPKKGNYNGNKTKTMRFTRFWDVPKWGPFFDFAFARHNRHGQDVHLLQMDFVEPLIRDLTANQPRIFWDYVTSEKGSWVWDTMFDGTNSDYMHPETLGPLVREYIPLH
jgi:hypothetical protein